MAISQIDLFTALKEKLGESQANLLTEYVEQRATVTVDAAKEHLATNEDIAMLDGEISESKADILKWMFAMFAPVLYWNDCFSYRALPAA